MGRGRKNKKFYFDRQVDAALRRFADGRKASEKYLDEGIRYFEKVRHFLEKQIRHAGRGESNFFSIASIHYAGSVGKHTDIHKPDFDIVMKINNREPPFEEVLRFWETVLCGSAKKLKIISDTIRLTPYTIQFTFSNGMEVDLLPAAANLTEHEITQMMREKPKMKRYWRSSLVLSQVKFMKFTGSFTHAVARFSKFWYKSMEIDISGGSTIFELLAVAAVLEETRENPDCRESMTAAFSRVIEYVQNLEGLRMAFGRMGSGGWNVTACGGQRVPYLIEPSSYNENMLDVVDEQEMKILMHNGGKMKERFSQLVAGTKFCEVVRSQVEIDTDKLFQPV